jgi:hypothetical protein
MNIASKNKQGSMPSPYMGTYSTLRHNGELVEYLSFLSQLAGAPLCCTTLWRNMSYFYTSYFLIENIDLICC